MSGETLNIPLGSSHTATLTVPHKIQNQSEVRKKVTEVANQIFKDMSLQKATYILATINNPNTSSSNFYDLKATNPGDTSLTPQHNISSNIEAKIQELRNLIWLPVAPQANKFDPNKAGGQRMASASSSALLKQKAKLKRAGARPSSSSSSPSTSGSEMDRVRAGLKPVSTRNPSHSPSSSSSTSGSEADQVRAGLRSNPQTRQSTPPPAAPLAPSLPSTARDPETRASKNSRSDVRSASAAKPDLDILASIKQQIKRNKANRASGSSSSSFSATHVQAKADPLAALRRQLRDKRTQNSSMNSASLSSSERTLHAPVPVGNRSSLDLHDEHQEKQQRQASEGSKVLQRVRDGQPLSVIFSTKNADSLEPALSRAMEGLELNSQAATISPFIEKQFSLPLENSSLSRSTSAITVNSSDDEDEPASLEITPFSRASSELSDTSDSDGEFEALSNSAAGRMLNTLRQKDQELVHLQQASSSTSDKSDIESQKTSILQNIKTLEPLIVQISDNLNENDDDFEIMSSHCDRFMAYENFSLKLEKDPIITPQMIEKIYTDLNQFTHDIIQLVTESRRVDSYPEKEGSDEALI